MMTRLARPILALVPALLIATAPVPAAQADEAPDPAQTTERDMLFGGSLGLDLPWMRVGTDGAVYEAPRYGGDARLFVREKSDRDDRWRVYRGADFQGIVKSSPELGANASIELLGTRIGGKAGLQRAGTKPPRAGLQTYVRAPGMTYEKSSFDAKARLYVREGEREYVYVGNDIDAIVRHNPALTKNKAYDALRADIEALQRDWRTQPTQPVSTHLEVWKADDGYTVKTWTHAEGRWTSNTYQGTSLETIVRENPAAASHVRMWSDAAWASTPQADSDTASPVDETSPDASRDSIEFAGLELVTQPHEDGTCVVVREAGDGVWSSELGLESGDRIVRVDYHPVSTLEDAKARLLKLSEKRSGVVCVQRDGKDMCLSLGEKASTASPRSDTK